ncbi:MAG: molybdopterin dinucleotide binding domain-containing protein [Acidimicrobiia bacterium]
MKWRELYHASFLRKIHDQQMIQVVNGQGTLQIPLMITDDIIEGVVCLLQGNWPDLDENGIDHGGAVNILTSTEPSRPSMGSRTHSVAVEVNQSAVPDRIRLTTDNTDK